MTAILAIARTWFRRIVRSRVVLAACVIAVGLMFYSVYLSISMSKHGGEAVASGFAWELLEQFAIFGFIAAVLLGAGTVHADSKDRTWQAILTKPVRPVQIVVGKFLGSMAVLAIPSVLVWGAGHVLALVYMGQWTPRLDLAFAMMLLGCGVAVSVALALALRLHPVAAIAIALALRYDLVAVVFETVTMVRLPGWALVLPAMLLSAVWAIAPAYDLFDLTWALSEAAAIAWKYVGLVALYGCFLAAVFLLFATRALARRELGAGS
jgi:Cu-processing system permease protein